jgi:hypothetical protein
MFLTLLSQLKSHTWKVRRYLVLANGKQMFLKLEDDSHKHDGINYFHLCVNHIPKNNMNNHSIMLINTITWFSLSKVLRSWKLSVGRNMAYKTITAYLACSMFCITKIY